MLEQTTTVVPVEYLCPILKKIMSDPVVARDSHTYEREAMVTHFQQNVQPDGTVHSPIEQGSIKQKLISNKNLRSQIREFIIKNPQFLNDVYFPEANFMEAMEAISTDDTVALSRLIDNDQRILQKPFEMHNGKRLLELAIEHSSLDIISVVQEKLKLFYPETSVTKEDKHTSEKSPNEKDAIENQGPISKQPLTAEMISMLTQKQIQNTNTEPLYDHKSKKTAKDYTDFIAMEVIQKIEPDLASSQSSDYAQSNISPEKLFLKLVELAKDEMCPIVTLRTIAEILTEDPSTITSEAHANKLVKLLSNLDAVDFMELNSALIPQYVSRMAEGEDQGASIFRNETVEGISEKSKYIVLTLHVRDELSLLKLKQVSKAHDYSPILLKKGEHIYIYGAEQNQWKIIELDKAIFREIEFPISTQKPFVLQETSISLKIRKEISLKKGHAPVVDYRNVLIMGLMKQQIVKEESGDYVRATLFPRFNELAQKTMKRYLSSKLENKTYNLYSDNIMIQWMIEAAGNYVEELRAIRKAIGEVPAGIRANCYLVLDSILKKLFPNNQASKNPYFNNPKKSRLSKDKKIPRAAFGLFLLYLNLRLMGLFINEKMEQLKKEGMEDCFTDPELREAISLLKLNKYFNKNKLASLEDEEDEIIKILETNTQLQNHFIKKTTAALKKDPTLIDNQFILYIQIKYGLAENTLDLTFLIRLAINTTFCTSVNVVVNDYRLEHNDIDMSSLSSERQLAQTIYSATYQGFSSGYRRVLANLAKKSPEELANEELAKNMELQLSSVKQTNDPDDTDMAASTSGTMTVTLKQSGTAPSLDSTDGIQELDPIWQPLFKRLTLCLDLEELYRIIQDSLDNLSPHKKPNNEHPSLVAALTIIKIPERKTLLSKLFKPAAPNQEIIKKKPNYDTPDSLINIFRELELLSQERQTTKNRDSVRELFERDPNEFIGFFQTKLTECMDGLVKKVVYFRYTFNPFFQFSQKCLEENDAQTLRDHLEETIKNHKLPDALKARLKSKEGLKLDESIPRFPTEENEMEEHDQSWVSRCTIS